MRRVLALLIASMVTLAAATPAGADDLRLPGEPHIVKAPPPLLRPTTQPLIRSASNYPHYETRCEPGHVCTVCIAGCVAGMPHVLQAKPLPLVSTRLKETADQRARREAAGHSVKPEWARIYCGNDGCTGKGAPIGSRSIDVNISIFRNY